MKWFKCLILILMLTVFFAACEKEKEVFDLDFNEPSTSVSYNGLKLQYAFSPLSFTRGMITEDHFMGYEQDSSFADMARKRLADVEAKYECEILLDYEFGALIEQALSGILKYDAITIAGGDVAAMMNLNLLAGMSTLSDYIDYIDEYKWGYRNQLEMVCKDGDVYGVLPTAWPELTQSAWGWPLIFNGDIIIDALGLTDPREYVEEKTWDWAQFRESLADYYRTEGGTVVNHSIAVYNRYFAQMFIRSNGSSISITEDGKHHWGFTDKRAVRAMEEAYDIFYTDLPYVFGTGENEKAGWMNNLNYFLQEKTALVALNSNDVIGINGRISLELSNFGILPWPYGPDVEPGYIPAAVSEDIAFCTCIPLMSENNEASAVIINDIYEPFEELPDERSIIEYLGRNFFFDIRDAEIYYKLFRSAEYSYFGVLYGDYDAYPLVEGYITKRNTSVTSYIESYNEIFEGYYEEIILPKVQTIESIWGSYRQ